VTFRQRIRLVNVLLPLGVLAVMVWWAIYGRRLPFVALVVVVGVLFFLALLVPTSCGACGREVFLHRVRLGPSHFHIYVRRPSWPPFSVPRTCPECGADLDRAWAKRSQAKT